jgi:CBS domain-containing protein
MKVKGAMIMTPYYAPLWANLGMATELMWMGNCGFLPVIDAGHRVAGVITDRDICVALGTRNQLAEEVRVEEIVQRKVYSCGPEDEIHVALQSMKEGHVRRLPVLRRGLFRFHRQILLHDRPEQQIGIRKKKRACPCNAADTPPGRNAQRFEAGKN